MDYTRYDKKTQQLIKECERLYSAGDVKALSYFRKLENLAKEQKDNGLLGFVYFYVANLYYDESEYEKFLSSLDKGISALLKSNDYQLLARAYNFFAIAAQINNALDVAYSYYTNALQYVDEKEDAAVAGIVIQNIGNFYNEIGDYGQARKYYRKAIRLLQKDKDDPRFHRNLTIAYINDGVNSVLMKDAPQARITLKKINKILLGVDESRMPDLVLSNMFFEARLAMIEGNKDRVEELMPLIMESLKRNEIALLDLDDLPGFCTALIADGQLDKVGEILDVVSPSVMELDIAYSKRLLSGIKIEYYDKIGDEKKLVDNLREQHSILLQQKKEQVAIYKHSMHLINVVSEMQEEEKQVRLENQHLQVQILTDGLTKIPNRYALDQEISAAFERSYKKKKSFGVEILDINDFKGFNDNYGHLEGDKCLEALGEILNIISQDENVFCARYGGDEFVIIYEDKSDEDIKRVTQRISQEMGKGGVTDNIGPSRPISISAGACNHIPRVGSKPWDYMTAADDALYAVKGKKNRVLKITDLPEFGLKK